MRAAPLLRLLALIGLLAVMAGCHRPTPRTSASLPQRAYLWQRDWTPAVAAALPEAAKHLSGVVVLGGQIRLAGGKTSALQPAIDWEALRASQLPCAVALRIDPFAGPFAANDPVITSACEVARALVQKARAHGIQLTEFQLDFDCAQRKLAGYRIWLRQFRAAIAPLRFVITTLPAWLDQSEFAGLIAETDGYVLQVHSVPLREEGSARLCDETAARAWVEKAARLGRPFSVALPTYRCVGGYAPDGKLLSVAMDSTQPSWPPGTRTIELAADATSLAALLHEWKSSRPAALREVLWYRLPVSTDLRNWRWPTLAAVMEGRTPASRLEVTREGENPIDLKLHNRGETDESLDCEITLTAPAPPQTYDALSGWTATVEGRVLHFTPSQQTRLRLAPGDSRPVGWVRYEAPGSIELHVSAAGSR